MVLEDPQVVPIDEPMSPAQHVIQLEGQPQVGENPQPAQQQQPIEDQPPPAPVAQPDQGAQRDQGAPEQPPEDQATIEEPQLEDNREPQNQVPPVHDEFHPE